MRRFGLAVISSLLSMVIMLAGCGGHAPTSIPSPAPEPISTPTPSPASTPILEPPKIEEGWVRLRIADVGSIDYPTDFLELQSGDYRDIDRETSQVLGLGKSDFTLQQVGLNKLLPSAFKEYRRVILQTKYLKPGEEVGRANEKFEMSREELTELENQLKNQSWQEFISLEIKEVNGMFPLVHTYKRQLGDNPVVLVKSYMFQNYDKIHYLVFSYRVMDEEECRDIYDKILDSFRLQ